MSQIDNPIVDRILSFGKHKGLRMSQVPDDYIGWMAHGTKQNKLSFGGHDWEKMALDEEARRKAGAPLPKGMDIEVLDQGHGAMVDMGEEGNTPPKEPVKDFLRATDPITFTRESVDSVIMLFLKEFVIRPDQDQMFHAWLEAWVSEVIRYGQKSPQTQTVNGQVLQRYNYAGGKFYFDVQNGVLVRVRKWTKNGGVNPVAQEGDSTASAEDSADGDRSGLNED